jgi:rubrerythrin
MDRPYFTRDIYNLQGGILGWNHHTLPDLPRLRVFAEDFSKTSLVDLLYNGMNLERGAWRFYTAVLENYSGASFARSIDVLARAEEGHARLLYSFWAEEQHDPEPFEEVYGAMVGDIVEGGQEVDVMVERLARLSDEPCLDIIEMALDIEFSAYDLYRSMAHCLSGTKMEHSFLAIAQAEKEHMRIASEALQYCK